MKNLKRSIAIIAALAFFSCSKKNNDTQPQQTTTTVDTTKIDNAKLMGEWHGISAYGMVYDSTGTLVEVNGPSKINQVQGTWWLDDLEAKFTFNSDNTFDHAKANGGTGDDLYGPYLPKHGQWQLTNDNKTLRMTYDGFSSDGLENFDVITFRENYMHLVLTATTAHTVSKFHLEFIR